MCLSDLEGDFGNEPNDHWPLSFKFKDFQRFLLICIFLPFFPQQKDFTCTTTSCHDIRNDSFSKFNTWRRHRSIIFTTRKAKCECTMEPQKSKWNLILFLLQSALRMKPYWRHLDGDSKSFCNESTDSIHAF